MALVLRSTRAMLEPSSPIERGLMAESTPTLRVPAETIAVPPPLTERKLRVWVAAASKVPPFTVTPVLVAIEPVTPAGLSKRMEAGLGLAVMSETVTRLLGPPSAPLLRTLRMPPETVTLPVKVLALGRTQAPKPDLVSEVVRLVPVPGPLPGASV